MAEGQFATPGPASYPDDSCRSVRLKAFSAEPARNHSSCDALYEWSSQSVSRVPSACRTTALDGLARRQSGEPDQADAVVLADPVVVRRVAEA